MTPPRKTVRLGAEAVAAAGDLLREGGLVAFGTETVYGLGADATNPTAVASIYAAKGRPSNNPLIVHVASAEDAFALVHEDTRARALAAQFWPGPLTLVLPRRDEAGICPAACANLDTLAVRVPGPALARALIAKAGRPIAGPSANRSGRVSPSSADHVMEELNGRIDAVLDGGPCPVGVESTVIDLSGPAARLLRPGVIDRATVEAVIGPLAIAGANESPDVLRGPGLLPSHYAPNLDLRLNADAAGSNEALLAFGPALEAPLIWQLSARGDLREAASRLYAGLRHLDREGARRGLTRIAAMPVPNHGIGLAINDRLSRAAAPRTDRSSDGRAA